MCGLYNVCLRTFPQSYAYAHTQKHPYTRIYSDGERRWVTLTTTGAKSVNVWHPPSFCWVTQPTHTHTFKFKEAKIRGRHERLMSKNAPNPITKVQTLCTVPHIHTFPITAPNNSKKYRLQLTKWVFYFTSNRSIIFPSHTPFNKLCAESSISIYDCFFFF